MEKLRVIIIDDDPDVAEIFSDYLLFKKIEVAGVGTNGQDAVILYETKKPDVVFLDLKMPNFDGIYAMREIRKIDPKAKIVTITGYSDYKKDEMIGLKPDAIVQKPFDIHTIIDVLKKLVPDSF